MNQDQLISTLEQIRKLADHALTRENFASGKRKGPKVSAELVSAAGGSLPAHILQLRDGGFLKSAKTPREVHDALQEQYSCALDRVSMALLRLQRRKKLRKASKQVDGKAQVAYVW
jgi:hypothetical protein